MFLLPVVASLLHMNTSNMTNACVGVVFCDMELLFVNLVEQREI